MGDGRKHSTRIEFLKEGNSVVVGEITPHESLMRSLDNAADILQHTDRIFLQRLAYCLCAMGETEACEIIMKHAKEPIAYEGWGMYGSFSFGP